MSEFVNYLVCVPASEGPGFADDEFAPCCECGVRVRFRPHAPKDANRICTSCAGPLMARQLADGGIIEHVVTRETALEIALLKAPAGGTA